MGAVSLVCREPAQATKPPHHDGQVPLNHLVFLSPLSLQKTQRTSLTMFTMTAKGFTPIPQSQRPYCTDPTNRLTVKLLMPSENAPICLTVPSESSIYNKQRRNHELIITYLYHGVDWVGRDLTNHLSPILC